VFQQQPLSFQRQRKSVQIKKRRVKFQRETDPISPEAAATVPSEWSSSIAIASMNESMNMMWSFTKSTSSESSMTFHQ